MPPQVQPPSSGRTSSVVIDSLRRSVKIEQRRSITVPRRAPALPCLLGLGYIHSQAPCRRQSAPAVWWPSGSTVRFPQWILRSAALTRLSLGPARTQRIGRPLGIAAKLRNEL